MNTKIILENVRCTYVFIREPRPQRPNAKVIKKPSYGMCILLPDDDERLKKIRTMVKRAAKLKFGDDVRLKRLKRPLRDGEERDEKEYRNHVFFNANSPHKPGIVNRQNETADQDDIDELCYSGAYFHVSVTFFAYDSDGTKGVAAGLNNVMLRKKGKRLDGQVDAQDEFEKYYENKDDDDEDDDDW